MRSIKIGTHDVELYDSIEELPVTRYHKYQKFLLVDSGVGSSIEDFDKHIEKARRFCMLGDTASVQKELDNLRQNVFMIQAGLSPSHLAFACLVFAIDNIQCVDISDDGLKKIVETFADAPNQQLQDALDSAKKKIDEELTLYFPKLNEGGDAKEFFEILRRRTLLVLNRIAAGDSDPEASAEVEDITTELITYTRPQTFGGSDSLEIQFTRQFENLCITLSSQLNIAPKNYTVLEFYNAFEFLKEKIKAEEKAAKQARGRR